MLTAHTITRSSIVFHFPPNPRPAAVVTPFSPKSPPPTIMRRGGTAFNKRVSQRPVEVWSHHAPCVRSSFPTRCASFLCERFLETVTIPYLLVALPSAMSVSDDQPPTPQQRRRQIRFLDGMRYTFSCQKCRSFHKYFSKMLLVTADDERWPLAYVVASGGCSSGLGRESKIEGGAPCE